MGTASIYSYGSPVVDISGYSMKIVANYRDKSSTAAADHSAADASPGLANGISAIGLEVTTIGPLSKIFDSLWNGTKDKNGQTMRDRATTQAVQEIQSNGGSSISGSFPETGTLLALAEPLGGQFFLSYWLPNAQFHFSKEALGADWNLTFDTEVFIAIALQDWPNVPAPVGAVNLSNANVSAANLGADVDEGVDQISTFFSTSNSGIDGGNIFAIDEGNVDSTPVPGVNLPSLWQLISTLESQSYPVGFTKCGVFLGATTADTVEGKTPTPTVNIRLVHPIDPAPKLVNTAVRTGLQLIVPAITVSPTQVSAGGKLVVTGQHFPAAQANAAYVGWNDTVSGALMASEVQWSASGKPAKNTQISRTAYDNKNSYTITGLDAGTSYTVQVRDADLLTYTDWSNSLTIKTDANNNVDLSLKSGSTSASLGSAARDSAGSFTATVTVPAGTSTGEHTLVATDGSASASTTVDILAAGQSATPKLYVINTTTGTVMPTPVTMPQGATFTLQGEGFAQGSVALTIQGGKSLGTANAGADGTFSAKVTPPVESGGYTIVATQSSGTSQRQATLAFVVLAQPK
jgi:hypothetical protein